MWFTQVVKAPPPIAPGSVLRVVAPSGPFSREQVECTIERLRQRYEVRHREDMFATEGYLAGSDERRAAELNEAMRDPRAHAIFCARGGFGVTRILERLDFEPLKEHAKWLVGFSDVTALHLQWARHGLWSLHAPMAAWLGAREPLLTDVLVDALEQRGRYGSAELTSMSPGAATGPLLGGNLTLIASLAGTPFAHRFSGSLLFLEDVGERPYRADRMLTQLHQSGAFEGVLGVVLGEFIDCAPGKDGVGIEDVIRQRFAEYGVPVASGLAVGHGEENHALTLGAVYRLECASKKGSLVRI